MDRRYRKVDTVPCFTYHSKLTNLVPPSSCLENKNLVIIWLFSGHWVSHPSPRASLLSTLSFFPWCFLTLCSSHPKDKYDKYRGYKTARCLVQSRALPLACYRPRVQAAKNEWIRTRRHAHSQYGNDSGRSLMTSLQLHDERTWQR